MKDYMRNRYHNDPEFRKRMLNSAKNYALRYPIRTWANSVIGGHRRRGISIEVTRIQLEKLAEETKTCFYCGCLLRYGPQNGKKRWHRDSASVDRIDNEKPLSINNIQILCCQCNLAKNKMTAKEFSEWIKKVYQNLFRNNETVL